MVESVEKAVLLGEMQGCDLFIFMDNTTSEGGYCQGNSDNKILFSLILHLQLLEMTYSLHLHVVHVAGTHMAQQGTGGLSCGLHTDGVFAKQSVSLHIPLHLSTLDRSSLFLPYGYSPGVLNHLLHCSPHLSGLLQDTVFRDTAYLQRV